MRRFCRQNFWENTLVKAKSKMLKNRWKNWKNGHQGMATWHILYDKDRDTLIEQSGIVLGQHYAHRNDD